MKTSLPLHVAIIPDGNRRWAKERGERSLAGHSAGAKALDRIARAALDRGIENLTVWGMSLDNFQKRELTEIRGLLDIFKDRFTALADDDLIHTKQVRIRAIGDWARLFPASVKTAIERAQEATRNYNSHSLNVLLAYNGTEDVRQAAQALVTAGRTDQGLTVTNTKFKQYLLTHDLPAVDLLIRTGGEQRLSAGFMMWDVADAELYFTPTLWPDFAVEDFDAALHDFAGRQRKFGS